MEKKIMYIIFGIYFVVSVIFGAVLSYKLGQYRRQSEYYRIELTNAENRERQLADTIDKCWESTERTKELLGSTVSSVAELREQLKEVRKNYENMEVLLLDCYDNMHSGNNGTTNYIKEIE